MRIISRIKTAQDITLDSICDYYIHELGFGLLYVLDFESSRKAEVIARLIEKEEKILCLYLDDVEFEKVVKQIFIQLTECNDKEVVFLHMWDSARQTLAFDLIQNVVNQFEKKIFKYSGDIHT